MLASEVVNLAVSPTKKPETQIDSRPAIVGRYGYLVNARAGGGVIVTYPALRWVWSDGAETGLTAGAPFVCWHSGEAGRNHDDCDHIRLLSETAEPEW